MTTTPSFRLEQQIEELNIFMETLAYKNFLLGHQRSIEAVKSNIVMLPPDEPKTISELLKLHGQLELLLQTENQFEDIRAALKTELDKVIELETKGTK